jgi:hypothetical protein
MDQPDLKLFVVMLHPDRLQQVLQVQLLQAPVVPVVVVPVVVVVVVVTRDVEEMVLPEVVV